MPPAGRGNGGVVVTLHEQVHNRAAIFMQNSTFPTFKETEGSTGYALWRKAFFAATTAAGQDFLLALEYGQDIPVAVPLAAASVLDDTLASVPTFNLSQIRQHALLQVLRATLTDGGEALTSSSNPVHMRADSWAAGPRPCRSSTTGGCLHHLQMGLHQT